MWLDTVKRTLDQRSAPVCFFFRDDDAGWADAELWALLDVFDQHAVAIDLAVIPEALTHTAAHVLDARRSATPHLVGLHQHGVRHVNYQSLGRKSEFGDGRPYENQLADLQWGQRRLFELLGRTDTIFTPPWNRCTDTTVQCLSTIGFTTLSRDWTAKPIQWTLSEISVRIDWCKHRADSPARWITLGDHIATAIEESRLVGVMLHHAVMSRSDLGHLAELLAMLREHGNARFALMRDLTDSRPQQYQDNTRRKSA